MSNWDRYKDWTVGRILEQLHSEGIPIKRETFWRWEAEGMWPVRRTYGGFRMYDELDARVIMITIRKLYGIETEYD